MKYNMKQTPQDTPIQKSFADIPDDPRPAPLIAAEKWGFPLQHYQASDGKTYFAVQDWIVGLVGCTNVAAGKMWRQFKASDSYASFKAENQTDISNVTLPYQASDGKTYQREYIDDRLAYLLSQYLRTGNDRPMLDEVRQFLAKSASTMDFWRRNPEQMLSAAQARMQSDIDRHEKAGLGNRPEILALKANLELSKTLNSLKSSIGRLLELSKHEWGTFHNDEMWYLLGYTAEEIKKARDPKKSARANMNLFESNSLNYCEQQLIALLAMQKTLDPQRLKESVKFIFTPVGENLRGMLESLGIDVLTGKYQLPDGKQ